MLRAMLMLAAIGFLTNAHDHKLCEGFLPENNLYISPADPDAAGITERDFNDVLDEIENYYAPVIANRGGRLQVNREWNNGIVNASADRQGSTYNINMYGGLARHHTVTKDAFMLVACHEMGHHIGGAPKIAGWFGGGWATNEGGADYFASLRCLRAMFKDSDNQQFALTATIDPTLRNKCEQVYDTQAEENLCFRIGMAGYQAGHMFHILKQTPNEVAFTTPDQNRVTETDDDHPAPQCRLDTYYQGGICRHDMNTNLSDSDARLGTCNESTGQAEGNRPRCWYAP